MLGCGVLRDDVITLKYNGFLNLKIERDFIFIKKKSNFLSSNISLIEDI